MVRKSSGSNTRLYVALGIVAFAIIIGTIFGSSYREYFTNPSKELVYLYMESCGYCEKFTPIWDQMADNNKDTFTFNKYDLNTDARGKELADKYNVRSAPTIIMLPIPADLKEDDKLKYFYDGDRTEKKIIAWANSFQ